MNTSPDVEWRIAEMLMFETCTYKCSYCHFAESGKVLDAMQVRPYRDPEFIRKITGFFDRRTTDSQKWLLMLTGGEPLLMPNFELFCEQVAAAGNKIALYTAMMIGREQAAFRYLIDRGVRMTDYLMVSYHPEAEDFEDEFFEKLRLLKQAGHSVIFRFVGHPGRLQRMEHLSDRCREIDVSFYPTPLFSPDYPSAYTDEERELLTAHMASTSQIIQLANGIDTRSTGCHAASRVISIDMRTGNIVPCASVHGPLLGNVYEDVLVSASKPIRCPSAGISCLCDIHFQQNVVMGAEDSAYFDRHKQGWVEPMLKGRSWESIHREVGEKFATRGLAFSSETPGIGQTKTASNVQAFSKSVVKSTYELAKPQIEQSHRTHNHPEWLRRAI